MISLVYISSATTLLPSQDLVELLHASRAKNQRLGITGMLLYQDGNIMQALEGPEDAVQSLYATIRKDRRHTGVTVILQRTIAEREFSEWTMGFRDLNDVSLRETPGYSEFLNQPLGSPSFQKNPHYARKLLDVFRQAMV